MCDQCNNTPPSPLSRRDILKLAGLGIAAALTGCEGPAPIVTNLPDATTTYDDHLITGSGGAPVHIDPKKIIVPPPQPPQTSTYGDIMPGAAWTRVPLKLSDGIPMDGVHKISIHHSGDGKPFLGESVADVARHLQIVQMAHLQRGMIDIAYHFAVDRTGRLWQLRWLGYRGQHVRPSTNGTINNENNVGIVALGDFNLQDPTPAQRTRLFALVRLVRAQYALPPAAVFMHGEIVSTDCPGKRLSPYIRDARRRNLL